jgi:hypothetical protein
MAITPDPIVRTPPTVRSFYVARLWIPTGTHTAYNGVVRCDRSEHSIHSLPRIQDNQTTMLVIPLSRTSELIAATAVALLFLATALAFCCCCRKQIRGAASTSTDDENTNSNNNNDNDDDLDERSQGRRCFSCCFRKKRTQTRDFATLNDLLLEVDDNETGWLHVVSTPRSATEQSRLQVSVESFFPDILTEASRKKGRDRAGTGGSREDLHETLL